MAGLQIRAIWICSVFSTTTFSIHVHTRGHTHTQTYTTHTHTHTHTHRCTAQNTSCGSLISYHDDDQLYFCSLTSLCVRPACSTYSAWPWVSHLTFLRLSPPTVQWEYSQNPWQDTWEELSMVPELGKHLDKFSYHLYYSATWLLCGVWLFATPMDRLSMGLSRQESWSGLPFSSPGDRPKPGTEPASPTSPALAGRFFTTEQPGKPKKN